MFLLGYFKFFYWLNIYLLTYLPIFLLPLVSKIIERVRGAIHTHIATLIGNLPEVGGWVSKQSVNNVA